MNNPFASAQGAKLRRLLDTTASTNPFYGRKFSKAGFDPASVEPDAPLEAILDRLPFTRKEELLDDQQAHPPFGTNLTYPLERYTRFHQTSGTSGRPLAWLDTSRSWQWVLDCWRKVYRGVGIQPSDRFFFPFSFGPFLGFWSAFEGAILNGNLCLPGGGMSTLARLQVIRDRAITVLAATPTYALRMAATARSEGIDLPATAVRAIVVAGEPGGSIPATKEQIESAWGARCFDHCGMTEVGPVGFECTERQGGMHVLEDDYIVEVLEPGTLQRVKDGARGELVLTNLGRGGSPVIRYRTGDIVRWTRKPCSCGASYGTLDGGILGRIDDMVFVRGNNLYPAAIEAVLRTFREIVEYRIRIRREHGMIRLLVEVEPDAAVKDPGQLEMQIGSALQANLLFRVEVTAVAAGTLPKFDLKSHRWVKEY